jgi:TonB-dependent starch-binding outer membrane protein SusC
VVTGYHFEGVNPATGLFQLRLVDGNPFPDYRDILVGGNTDVHYYGGCSQTFRYKNWQLDLFVEFRVQGGVNPYVVLYEQNPPGFAAPSMLGNAPVEWLHRWQRPGDHTSLEKATENPGSDASVAIYDYVASDARVTDASFVRLKSMRLSYQLPERQLSRQGLRECRLYLEGQNLLTFTHFPVTDPETQDPTVLPPMKTIVAGVRVVF